MISCALLYNFNGKKAEMTKMVCMMMNIRFKSVGQEDYHQPLGALLGVEGVEQKPAKDDNEPMAEEMLLLHGFGADKLQKFLTALQRVGVGRIDLKAMLTENNRTWSGLDLYEELCKEREAFKKLEEEKRRQKQQAGANAEK